MSQEYTPFPPLPNGLVIHPQVGPLFDRMQMQSYALKMADAATLRQCAACVGVPENNSASVAAIQFALSGEDGMAFLRCWNEGNFDACRNEWPEAPAECYIGADPIAASSAPQVAPHG